jgi:Fe-S-cluster containining protein
MPGILCEHCTAVCCRYIALPIDTPRQRSDFDDIRWYLLHEGVSIFVEEGDWYISFVSNCRHLQPDSRCGIYETRPRICREYSTSGCDYHSGDYGWEAHFTCPEHLDEYVRAHGFDRKRPSRAPRGRSADKRRRPGLKVRLSKGGRPAKRYAVDYSAATADIRGIPLPVLGAPR